MPKNRLSRRAPAPRGRTPRAGWPAAWLMGACLTLAGCMSNPEVAPTVVQAKTPTSKTISSFTSSLQCMDTLLWQHGKRDIYIMTSGIPDATGKVAAGTKEMLITAISRMSARSNAFRFVDFEPNPTSDVTALSALIGVQPGFIVPSYYIRGAITQLDENVLSELQGGSISLPFLDIGASRDQIVSVVSVDLNVGEVVTRQILPGMSASNSIAVVRSGISGDAGGRIDKAGFAFNVAFNKSEGFHQAVRTLVDLSTVETLGKLARVPYWQCLGLDQTNPTFQAQAREWFDTTPPDEQIRFAQQVLSGTRYYEGPITGIYDTATKDAAARYQADNDLVPTGRIDFDLYYSMLGKPGVILNAPGRTATIANAGGTGIPLIPTDPGAARKLDIFLNTDRGPVPKFKVGETLVVKAQSTADAFLYCYYQDSDGKVARVFPNRFQPDALVTASQQIEIPPGYEKPFNIRLDNVGESEAVACFASAREVGLSLPDAMKLEDLKPMPQVTLQGVAQAFEAIPGGDIRSKRLNLRVLPANTVDF
jgi:peptidoglycan hydrolase-like protein with peptidoglycan-binding domain/curli biogenesis system outer membrane secretion channel CsgG